MQNKQATQLPPLVPRWRSLKNAIRLVRNPIPLLLENVRLYGKTYAFHVGGLKKGVFSIEPEFIRHVLQKNHRNFQKSGLQTGILSQYIGRGLLTAEGEYWLQQRRLIQPFFHREIIGSLIGLMQEEIDKVMDETQVLSEKGAVDVYMLMHRLTFRIIVRTLFSKGFPEEQIELLSKHITQIQGMIIRQIRQPYFRAWFKLSGMIARHQKLAAEARQIILEQIRDRKESGIKENDLLQMLLDARYSDSDKGMTDEQILDECMILFVAGHETSANALSWSLLLLAKHPIVLRKLRAEYRNSATEKQGSTEQLKNLRYTGMVLNEAMRLYPPAWVIDRQSLEEDEIMRYRIPPDTFLILLIYGLHHDPDLWDDPEKFDPERFAPEAVKEHIPFSFAPFGGGPRLCIGNHFAFTEMQLALKAFVERFDFSLVPGQEIAALPLVTLRPKEGVKMHIRSKDED